MIHTASDCFLMLKKLHVKKPYTGVLIEIKGTKAIAVTLSMWRDRKVAANLTWRFLCSRNILMDISYMLTIVREHVQSL